MYTIEMETNDNNLKVVSSPEKGIPKYATSVSIGKLQNKNIILTFLYQIPINPDKVGKVEQSGLVIDTIVIDEEHAKKIVETLDKVVKTEVLQDEKPPSIKIDA